MQLHELFPFAEERKARKRIGRGAGTGWGSSAGKGLKGQNQRSGSGKGAYFEGGQMPLQRRLPKYGFTNIFKVTYEVINLDRVASVFAGKTEVTLDDFYSAGLAANGKPVKILGNGEITAAMSIEAHKFSASAKEKIEKAGGNVKALEG